MNNLGNRVGAIGCFLIALIAIFLPSLRIAGIWVENVNVFDFIRGYQLPFGVREDMRSLDIAMYGIQVIMIGIALSILISIIFLLINKHIDVIFPLQILSSITVFILMIGAFLLGATTGNFVEISLHVGGFIFLLALLGATVLARLSRPPKLKEQRPDPYHSLLMQGLDPRHSFTSPSSISVSPGPTSVSPNPTSVGPSPTFMSPNPTSVSSNPTSRYKTPHLEHGFCTECGRRVYKGRTCSCQVIRRKDAL